MREEESKFCTWSLRCDARIGKVIAVKIRRSHVIVASVVLLGLIFMTLGVRFLSKPTKYFAHSLRHPQDADSVAGYPIAVDGSDEENPVFRTTEFKPNLSQLSPMERFRLPTIRHAAPPAGATAIAHGLVLYTGNPEGYSGQAILLGHRLPDDSIVQSFYAGLDSMDVRVGEQIAGGEELGTLGGPLFFELRNGAGIDIAKEEVAGVTLNTSSSSAPNRLDPTEFFQEFPPPGRPEAFAVMREMKLAEQSSLENLLIDFGGDFRLQERFGDDSAE